MKKIGLLVMPLMTISLLASCAKAKDCCTVTFDTDGGTEVKPQLVDRGKTAHRPKTPTKDEYSFNNWYQVNESGRMDENAFDFNNTPICEDVTLRAVWDRSYNFTFTGDHCSINGEYRYTENIIEGEKRIYNVESELYYEMPERVEVPKGVYYRKTDDTKATLTIVEMANNYVVNIGAPPKEIQVNVKIFKDDEFIMKTINTTAGSTWADIKSEVSDPSIVGYHFNGWSLSSSGGGPLIEDDYIFSKTTTIYGSFNYICSLTDADNCSLEIIDTSASYGKPLTVYLKIKDEKIRYYDLPPEKSNFTIVSDGRPITDFEYLTATSHATLTIPANKIGGEVNIAVTDYAPEYDVILSRYDPNKHIKFTGESVTRKGEDYTFNIEIVNDKDQVLYYVPDELSITIGDSSVPLSRDLYTITPDETQKIEYGGETYYLAATVTITGEVIDDFITVEGLANQVGYYLCEVVSYGGINSIEPQYKRNDEYQYIQLEKVAGQESYDFPKRENIYVSINNQAIGPLKQLTGDTIVYDENKGLFTIKPHVHASFTFHLMSDNYPLLENLSWQNISMLSSNDYAKYFFNIGEEKTVKVNNLNHKVRIIGFNHDMLVSSAGKAGITFEFVNVITNSDGKAATSNWGEINTREYVSGPLNKFLVGGVSYEGTTVLKMLPGDLRNELKTVKKKYHRYLAPSRSWSSESFSVPLFPLSWTEISGQRLINLDEGTQYKYFTDNPSASYRRKTTVDGGYEKYWTRSPDNNSYDAAYIDTNGDMYSTFSSFAVAPAFCI